MIEREKLLVELESLSEEKFRIFNEKIVHTSKYRVIGVRMPDLKAIAKKHRADYKEIFEMPYDSFEEIIIKGAAVGFADAPLCEKEPYIIRYAEMIDNWAECDCFCSCIKVKKSEADVLLVSALDEIAWTLNIRGNDVHCNPVVVSYLIINEQETHFFIQPEKVTEELSAYLEMPLEEIKDILRMAGDEMKEKQ